MPGSNARDPSHRGSQQAFNTFARHNLPLSQELHKRARGIVEHISTTYDVEALKDMDGDGITEAIKSLQLHPPRLGAMHSADVREAEQKWNAATGRYVSSRRYYVAVEVFGDASLLRYWPDAFSGEIQPVDHEMVESLGGLRALDQASPEQIDSYFAAADMWQVSAKDLPPPPGVPQLYLYSYLDLSPEQEGLVASGAMQPGDIFTARHRRIVPLVAAIEHQVAQFVSQELPRRLTETLRARLTELENRQAVIDTLTFPATWAAAPPMLASPDPRSGRPQGGVSTQRPSSQDDFVATARIDMKSRVRLDPVSFREVLYVVRLWADAVEHYPRSFGSLLEDQLSDLLVATLNATLPGANREVYSRGGKADIYIRADAIDTGKGPAAVFVCESKWARGHAIVRNALDPQLFGYLTTHDLAAILMLLMPQKNFHRARTAYLRVLEGIAGYIGQADEVVAGWPMLRYRRDGRTVVVCVAFVHLHTGAKAF